MPNRIVDFDSSLHAGAVNTKGRQAFERRRLRLISVWLALVAAFTASKGSIIACSSILDDGKIFRRGSRPLKRYLWHFDMHAIALVWRQEGKHSNTLSYAMPNLRTSLPSIGGRIVLCAKSQKTKKKQKTRTWYQMRTQMGGGLCFGHTKSYVPYHSLPGQFSHAVASLVPSRVSM